MKLLKKSKVKPITIGQVTRATLVVDGLKEKKVLRTSDTGAFYTFPEIMHIGPTPDNIAKNMYLYARTCNLIAQGQTLYFRDIEDNHLISQYDLKNGYIPIT